MKVSKKVIATLSLSCVLCIIGASNIHAEGRTERRISGSDRIETSIKIADEFGKSDNVVIATANSYADALVASPLAYEMQAPILLNGKKTLDQRILSKIKDLGAKKAVIVGGENSVSSDVENTLKNNGIETLRIAGANRYATSAKIADEYIKRVKADNAIIASGENFPDALVAGPYASKIKAPILLSQKGNLPYEIKEEYNRINPKKTIAVGGVNSLNPLNVSITERISGNSRYETALKVAERMNKGKAYIASGEIFADSLVAAPLAAKTQSPILLRARYTTTPEVQNYVNSGTKELITVGGKSTIEDGITNVSVQPENKNNTNTEVKIEKQPPTEDLNKKAEEIEIEFNKIINEYRKSHGKPKIVLDDTLKKGANIRAKETITLFEHVRPDGSSFKTAFEYRGRYQKLGENIAMFGGGDFDNLSSKEMARKVFEIWKHSPGHNAAMLEEKHKKHYLGIAFSGDSAYFSDNFSWSMEDIENDIRGLSQLEIDSEAESVIKNPPKLSQEKFESMVPQIKEEFDRIINSKRREAGIEPIKQLDATEEYAHKRAVKYSENERLPYYDDRDRPDLGEYIFDMSESSKLLEFDRESTTPEKIANDLYKERIGLHLHSAIEKEKIKSYALGLLCKDGYVYYHIEFYMEKPNKK